ncbi:MAG: IS5 family transposase [Cytophagaceae bacterium]|nr:MAG: IS5 family transposase [Cytophagaceae bacterium]
MRASGRIRWVFRPKKDAIGRSQKGPSSKIHLVVDSKGEPIQAIVSLEQTHDSVVAPELIRRLSTDVVIADKAYDSKAVIAALTEKSIQAVIPCRSNSLRPRKCDGRVYRRRIVIEKSFHKIKRFRALASRYAKTSSAFLALVQLASVKIWRL